MREQVFLVIDSGTPAFGYDLTELLCIPVDDDRCEEIEPCEPVILSAAGTITDFALATDAQGVFQSVVRLTFVQTDLGAALQLTVGEPSRDEEGALDTPDFAQRNGQGILAWIRREFAHDLTGLEDSHVHGHGDPKNVFPVIADQIFTYFAANQAAQVLGRGGRVEEEKPL